MGNRPRSIVAVLTLIALVAACGSSAPSQPGASAGGASPALSGSAPSGDIPADVLARLDAPTPADVGQGEVDLVQRLRDDARLADAIGPDGAATLTRLDAGKAAYGEELWQALDASAGLRGLVASSDGWPGGAPLPPDAFGGVTGLPTLSASVVIIGQLQTEIGRAMESSPVGTDVALQPRNGQPSTTDGVTERETFHARVRAMSGQGRLTIDVDLTTTIVRTDAATGANRGTVNGSVIAHFEMDVCPDAQGIAKGEYHIRVEESFIAPVAGQSSSTSGISDITAPFRVYANDQAKHAKTEFDGRASDAVVRDLRDAGNAVVDGASWTAAVGTTMTLTPGQRATAAVRDARSSDENASHRAVALEESMLVPGYVLSYVGEPAQAVWQSGECVELTTSEASRKVQPDEQLEIHITSRAKYGERDEISKPVVPTFTGKKEIDPTSDTPMDLPADLTFTAGSEPGDIGTIELKQVSDRGVGKKRLRFEVEPSDYLVTLAGHVSELGADLDMTMAPVRLTKTDRGWEGTGTARVTGSAEALGCRKSVTREMPVLLVGVPADRPPGDPEAIDILIAFTPGFEDQEESITCQGATTNADVPLADFQLPVLGANGRIEVDLDSPTTFSDSGATVTVTVTRPPPGT